MNIQQIEENIYRIPIPVPFPMKYIYCYLFRASDGWNVVDAGFNYPPAIETWLQVFADLDVEPKQIRSIYLTHFHPDHFGLAGWMQELTGAPVFISAEDFAMADRVFGPDSKQANRVAIMCRENGVPADLADKIEQNMEKLRAHVLPLPNLTILTDHEVTLGGDIWKVISTPGHSDGLICFYQPEKRLLLAADHILDKITPNISLWPDSRSNPLQDYLNSLNKVRSLDVLLTLPAHGEVIDNLSSRIDEIISHHERRLIQMLDLAKEGQSAYQIADGIFGHKNLTPHQWRFAIAETLAHLEFLVSGQKLVKVKNRGIIQYQANFYTVT
ncbi:MBL fold metallo-hydrolase [Polycladomyces abyssicola]|uniref:MBL fold metallo-hydrolase n=1 Tax=Polycladomyces abyssicola TaxID=1125966 RepID=A0A8D5ZJJ8_9BACL|nr:MBL fold metallo-hydrolase [Polycladomyces abyssicola]